MLLVIRIKDDDDIIGAKESIAARLEGLVGIERIDVCNDEGIVIPRLNLK